MPTVRVAIWCAEGVNHTLLIATHLPFIFIKIIEKTSLKWKIYPQLCYKKMKRLVFSVQNNK